MKRIAALVAALLLFTNAAYAVVVGYSRSESSGTTPTVTASNTSPNGTVSQISLASYTMAQSVISTGSPFYSITITVQSTSAAIPSGTIYCRVDNDQDMGSEYIEEVSYAYGGYAGGGPYIESIELVSSTNPTLPNGTLYFACQSSSAITVQRYNTTTTYTDGQYYYASYPSWNVTSTLSDRDMTFILKELK